MKEYVEAVKYGEPGKPGELIVMDWDIPVDQKERDTKKLSKEDKDAKIAAFKTKHGTSYKYRLHTCHHEPPVQRCTLGEI